MLSQGTAIGGGEGHTIKDKFTNFINKQMTLSKKELLEASDVTLVTQKRLKIYSYLNLFCLLIEIATIVLIETFVPRVYQLAYIFKERDVDQDEKTSLVPMKVEYEVEAAGWIIVFLLQLIYVIRGLPCMKPGQHYVNCLLLKIKFQFCILCLTFTIAASFFTFMGFVNHMIFGIAVVSVFVVVKSK